MNIASEENISSGTRNVNALIFVYNKSHDLKNLFALSQGNVFLIKFVKFNRCNLFYKSIYMHHVFVM